jgi:hypothetical protein
MKVMMATLSPYHNAQSNFVTSKKETANYRHRRSPKHPFASLSALEPQLARNHTLYDRNMKPHLRLMCWDLPVTSAQSSKQGK